MPRLIAPEKRTATPSISTVAISATMIERLASELAAASASARTRDDTTAQSTPG